MDDKAPQMQDNISITFHLKPQANSFCLPGSHASVHTPSSQTELEICSRVQ